MRSSASSSADLRIRAAVGLGLSLVAAACAEVGSPPGGPQDRTPPVLLDSRPDSLAVDVPVDAPLHFLFSEPMDRASARRALQVIPEVPLEKPRVRDRVITYRPTRGWPPDSVVVWTLTSQLKDKHGVAMAELRQGAFTTGRTLPPGAVEGVAVPPPAGDATAGTETRATIRAELSLPAPPGSRRAPRWRWAQADAGGRFRLDLLQVPSGPFLLEVYLDANANQRRDEREPVARRDSLYLAPADTILHLGRLELVDLEGPVALWACLVDPAPDSTGVWVTFHSETSEPAARAVAVDSTGCAQAQLTPGRVEVAAWRDLDGDGSFGPDSTGISEPFAPGVVQDLHPATPDSLVLEVEWMRLPWADVDTLRTPPIPRDLFSRGTP